MAQIKLVTKDTAISDNIKPLDWDVVIDSRPYYVIRLEGYVHSIGGRWGENDFWAYPRDEKPCYENLVEFSGEPVCWRIRYEPHNYTKTKWDECEARNCGPVYITRNGEAFCSLGSGINYGVDKARTLITEICEGPVDVNAIDYDKKIVGRKVYWRGEPAVVERFLKGQACVILKPDNGHSFKVPNEFSNDEDRGYYSEPTIKAEIWDKHIWWFRD